MDQVRSPYLSNKSPPKFAFNFSALLYPHQLPGLLLGNVLAISVMFNVDH